MINNNTPPLSEEIESAFSVHPPDVRRALLDCRRLIFETAARHLEIGPLSETLKWGQPAYLTEATKSGSTLRLGGFTEARNEGHLVHPALFVNCQTSLVEQFQTFYPETFTYGGKRALILRHPPESVGDQLGHCIALALTYHLRKRTKHYKTVSQPIKPGSN